MIRRKRRRAKLRPGDRRLLYDLAVLRAVMDDERVPAQKRLEQRLGSDLARALQASLADNAAKAA